MQDSILKHSIEHWKSKQSELELLESHADQLDRLFSASSDMEAFLRKNEFQKCLNVYLSAINVSFDKAPLILSLNIPLIASLHSKMLQLLSEMSHQVLQILSQGSPLPSELLLLLQLKLLGKILLKSAASEHSIAAVYLECKQRQWASLEKDKGLDSVRNYLLDVIVAFRLSFPSSKRVLSSFLNCKSDEIAAMDRPMQEKLHLAGSMGRVGWDFRSFLMKSSFSYQRTA
jgi:hypothetical protein